MFYSPFLSSLNCSFLCCSLVLVCRTHDEYQGFSCLKSKSKLLLAFLSPPFFIYRCAGWGDQRKQNKRQRLFIFKSCNSLLLLLLLLSIVWYCFARRFVLLLLISGECEWINWFPFLHIIWSGPQPNPTTPSFFSLVPFQPLILLHHTPMSIAPFFPCSKKCTSLFLFLTIHPSIPQPQKISWFWALTAKVQTENMMSHSESLVPPTWCHPWVNRTNASLLSQHSTFESGDTR